MIKKRTSADHNRFLCRVWIMSGIPFIVIGMLFVWAAAAGPSEKPSPALSPPPGLKTSGPTEVYGPDTLWEKINGGAEFYLSAGFVSLTSCLYEGLEDADTLIEVNAYHMGSLLNAFSVFSLQRRDNARAVNVAPIAYRTENAIYLVHGPYYLEILRIQPLDGPISRLAALARQFVRETPIQESDLPQLALFPLENLVPGSVAMIAEDAFGFEPLDKVFTAEYQTGQERSTVYISRRSSPAEARALAGGLYTYFENFGGEKVALNTVIPEARMLEIMGTYELMFTVGEYVAGVHEAATRKQAEKIAGMLADSLRAKEAASAD